MSGLISAPLGAIFGCAGLVLTDAERRFFRDADPLGFILFHRNIADPAQVRSLVAQLRDAVGREAPVLIDQEGGRVQRLRAPLWREAPPAAAIGQLAVRDPMAGSRSAWLNARLIAAELSALGIDVDCAPVLDLPVPGADGIIGDRAFGTDPALVAALGRAMMDGLVAGGVLPVVKHIPGHGRARFDSHERLSVIDASAETLAASDLVPFQALADAPFAMTAHLTYAAWDPDRPATLSARVIARVIRGLIGFAGALISDDIGMGALSGDLAGRARDAQMAGCDIILHCSGEFDEMAAIAAALSPPSAGAAERVNAALARRAPPGVSDLDALRLELETLMECDS